MFTILLLGVFTWVKSWKCKYRLRKNTFYYEKKQAEFFLPLSPCSLLLGPCSPSCYTLVLHTAPSVVKFGSHVMTFCGEEVSGRSCLSLRLAAAWAWNHTATLVRPRFHLYGLFFLSPPHLFPLHVLWTLSPDRCFLPSRNPPTPPSSNCVWLGNKLTVWWPKPLAPFFHNKNWMGEGREKGRKLSQSARSSW